MFSIMAVGMWTHSKVVCTTCRENSPIKAVFESVYDNSGESVVNLCQWLKKDLRLVTMLGICQIIGIEVFFKANQP